MSKSQPSQAPLWIILFLAGYMLLLITLCSYMWWMSSTPHYRPVEEEEEEFFGDSDTLEYFTVNDSNN
ncbi:hypothetical protein TSUD_257580 [Trifolium subterraneum]|uniref:Uncharacterized protein n=1 Tax=Trifolium subterraneum TaxID=3900 RepID=A0A2Z6LYI4_TRISU|nr:hypothetical protein TSUD_257580 [Trifolium subterraneum]